MSPVGELVSRNSLTNVIKTFKEGKKRKEVKSWVASSRNLDEGFLGFFSFGHVTWLAGS